MVRAISVALALRNPRFIGVDETDDDTDGQRDRRRLLALFEDPLEVPQILWQLPTRCSPGDAGNEEAAHSVAFKVHVDGDPRLGSVLDGFDGAMDIGCQRAPEALDRPGARWVVPSDHLCPGESTWTDFTDDRSTRTGSDGRTLRGAGGDCTDLPLGEPCKVCGVGEYVLGPTRYLNALPDRFHRSPMTSLNLPLLRFYRRRHLDEFQPLLQYPLKPGTGMSGASTRRLSIREFLAAI
jgi:hypothetical protein